MMSVEHNAGQRLMIGIEGISLSADTRQHLKEVSPGSVILFSRNIRDLDQVKRLICEIKETVDPPPCIAIDQEGGLVVRFFRDVTVMPGNMALGAARSSDLAYQQGVLTGRELKAMGIDINLAPVVDVVTGYDNPGITIRSFGADPSRAAALGSNLVAGMQSQGIAAVAKHFPGKGAAVQDAHVDLPVVDVSWEEMAAAHLRPFAACINGGVQGVMSSHVIYSRAPEEHDVPATFSRRLIAHCLRDELHFNGVVFSDDMEMGAISRFFPFAEAVNRAAQAGHDMILVCSDYRKQRAAHDVIIEACERDRIFDHETEVSVERIRQIRRFTERERSTMPDAVDAEAACRLAADIARRSITVLPGRASLPVSREETSSIFAIVPDLTSVESREDGFEAGEHNIIVRALKEAFPGRIEPAFLSLTASESEIAALTVKAGRAPLVLGFIFNARYISSQRFLVEHLQTLPTPTVFILVRNPFDRELLDQSRTTVITYGYRRVQIEAAVAVLSGSAPPMGILPFDEPSGEAPLR